MIAFKDFAASLLPRSEELLREWLSNGRKVGREWVVGSLQNEPGDSCKTNLDTGRGSDFATGKKWGDLLALYAAIHDISQLQAARELGAEDQPEKHGGAAPRVIDEKPDGIEMQRPPQAEFQPSMFKHHRYGTPSKFWIYQDHEGPLCAVARYDQEGQKKQIVPWIWNSFNWHAKAPPKPRPLYGLDRLAKYPDARVVIVEGEKCADAAERTYWAERPCISWMGGVAGVSHADWEPLRGRKVSLWPDCDEPGVKAMENVAQHLLDIGCQVIVVDPHEFGAYGYDLADAELAGRPPSEIHEYAARHFKTRKSSPPEPAPQSKDLGIDPPNDTPARAIGEPGIERPQDDATWKAQLRKRKDGTPYTDVNNVLISLEMNPKLSAIFRYNEFADKIEYAAPPPWADSSSNVWGDEDRVRLQSYLQGQGILVNRDVVVQDAVIVRAKQFSYHPIRDYLRGLTWDGKPRLDSWLSYYLGCEGNAEYLRAIGPRFLISAVARVMQPGCKADCVLVLEGPQGLGKSSAAKIFATKAWFSDALPDLHSKDAAIQLQGRWIQELPELAALNRSEIEPIKAFTSRQTDIYRPPYGRNTVERPRHCVFIATTNLAEYLADETGGRRFWPVRCGKRIDLEALQHDRDQLWSEARARFDGGEAWHLTQDLEELAVSQQSLRRLVPEHEERLLDFLDGLIAAGTKVTTMHDALRSAGGIEDFTKQGREAGALAKMFSRILVKEGWIKGEPTGRGAKRRLVYRYQG
jgi:putative DNA primase/helicase